MAETLTIVSERVDDIPVLLAHLDRLGVQPLLDAHVPTHGNWVGLSLGWVSVLWLTHLLSEGDHRLNHVAPWAKQRLQTLRECTGQPVHPLDVGNPKRATAHPTAERLLEAFQGLTLTIIREGRRQRRHLTPLSRVQQRILALLDFPVAIYTRLCPDSHKPP